MNNKIPMREYKNMTVYDWFNYTFPYGCGRPELNPPPITIVNRPRQNKRSSYAPDLVTDTILIASENYISNLTNPSDSPRLILLLSDDPNHLHAMEKNDHFHCRIKIWYCTRKHNKKRCYKNTRIPCSKCYDKDKRLHYCHGF